MYCNAQDVIALLPPSIKVGDNNFGLPSPGRPESNDRSKISIDQVYRYIKFADSEIDSRLRSFYVCPLRRIKSFETDVLNYINSGNSIQISVHDTGPFSRGDFVRIHGDVGGELCEVSSVDNIKSLTLKSVINNYESNGTSLSVLEFPDPIPFVSSRLAASYIFDYFFNSEQSPDISGYGKEQRQLAMNGLEGILTGSVFLFGQDHTGRRFVRGSLIDAYGLNIDNYQFGRERTNS